MRTGILVAAAFAAIALGWPPPLLAANAEYHVDPASSRLLIAVGKAGAFSFIAGHTHEVTGPIESGTVDVDSDDPSRSRIHIVIATSTLKVSGADEPAADRPKVQQAMESDKVLDVARYPRIVFESSAVVVKQRNGATLDVVVSGQLTIRNVTQPVTAPVHVELGDHAVTASGRLSVRQTAFGITPVSVGGVVAVKDALDITFSIAAR